MLDAQVLLIYGSETDPMFVDHRRCPARSTSTFIVLRLPGLNHDSAQTYGKPETIAAALRLFFGYERPDQQDPHRKAARVLGRTSRYVPARRGSCSCRDVGSQREVIEKRSAGLQRGAGQMRTLPNQPVHRKSQK